MRPAQVRQLSRVLFLPATARRLGLVRAVHFVGPSHPPPLRRHASLCEAPASIGLCLRGRAG